ncbi:hypothetical protein JMUB7551_28770 [Staphylococcus aureus]
MFFQAEDGIRDRSVSRGLGDVYKRQAIYLVTHQHLYTSQKIHASTFSNFKNKTTQQKRHHLNVGV